MNAPLYALLACLTVALVPAPAQNTVTYAPSSVDFPNPERGFYRASVTQSSDYAPLTVAQLRNYRDGESTSGGADYAVRATLVFRYFVLGDFRAGDISEAYLRNVRADFAAAREAGVKLIPRFAYTISPSTGDCGSFICPPYGDAPKRWVLRHIEQLAPVLRDNADVTAAVQMGFVGTWGEQFYTDHFGDASLSPFKLTDANWRDRNEVLDALLDAVPASRSVQVRYPQLKQRALFGVDAPTNAAALTAGEAYSGSDAARIGFHNDCLLTGADDTGTFFDYGNSSSPSRSDTANLRPYARADGRFVAVGGETCTDAYSPQNDCAGTDPAAFGDAELARYHYSYLNADYNNEVNNDWQSGGCMDAIKRELGYRFELRSGTYASDVAPGQEVAVDLDLANVGYGAPYNPRAVELVLRSEETGAVYTATLPGERRYDPRYWFGGGATHALSAAPCLPADMPPGNYRLLLNLPDPEPAIRDRPDYAIRLASLLPGGADVWDGATGYNDLGHTVTVSADAGAAACGGALAFVGSDGALPVDLVSFTAEIGDAGVELAWATASETDSEGFAVERATDGATFSEIAFVASRGDEDSGATYAYTDADIRPGTTYYYRLTQHDLDGTLTRSEVVTVRFLASVTSAKLAESLRVYPNPAGELLWVTGRAPPSPRPNSPSSTPSAASAGAGSAVRPSTSRYFRRGCTPSARRWTGKRSRGAYS